MGNKFDPDAFLALPENGTPPAAPMENARAKRRAEIDSYIKAASDHYGIDERVIHGIMNQESAYNPQATSPKGASGLMQLMPETARSLGVKDIYDPYENIMGGTKYIKQMLDTYGGNVKLALAAYNAGPGAVDKYRGIPPYAETKNYVARIYPGIANVQPYKRSVASEPAPQFDPDAFLSLPEQMPQDQGPSGNFQKISGEQAPETPSIPMEEYKGFQVPVGNNGRIRRAAIDRLMERQGNTPGGLTELITGQHKNPAGFGEAMGNAVSHFTNSALPFGLRGKLMGAGQAAGGELEKLLGLDNITGSVDPKVVEELKTKLSEYQNTPLQDRVASAATARVQELGDTLKGNDEFLEAMRTGQAPPDIPDEKKTFFDKAKENELIENEVLRLRKEQTPGSALAGEVMGSILPYNAASKMLNMVPGLAAVEKGKFIPEIAKLLGRGALANVAVGQAQNPSSDWKKIGVDAAFGAGGEAVGKLIPAVLKGIGSTVEKTGPQLVNTVLDVPVKDLKHGNFGEELLKKGLYGTEEGLLNKAQESIAKNSSKIESALKPAADAGQVLDNSTVLDELLAIKDKYATANKFTGTRPSEMRAIDRAIDRVKSLDPTNPLDAQAAKQEIYEIAQKAYGKDVLPIKSDIETATARGLKKGIENIVPEAKDLNQESSFMINLRDLLTNKIAKGKKMADVGLTPGGRGIVGSALGNMPTSLTLPAAQILRQVGRGIQGGTKAGQFISPTSGGGWFRVLEDLLQQQQQ